MNIYCTNDHEGKIVNAIATISCHDVGVCARPTLVDARDGSDQESMTSLAVRWNQSPQYAVAASLNQGRRQFRFVQPKLILPTVTHETEANER